jgi:hypothetical protein
LFEVISRIRHICGFNECYSLCRIEIPASAEFIDGFHGCISLMNIVFENGSHVREINMLNYGNSLTEIEIPPSIEILRGFKDCSELKSIIFSPNCCLRVIEGFIGCLLESIEIPASVERLKGFNFPSALSQISFAEGTKIKKINVKTMSIPLEERTSRVFVDYHEKDLMKNRRRLNVMQVRIHE